MSLTFCATSERNLSDETPAHDARPPRRSPPDQQETRIFRILVNQARTRAVREARSLPFSALEQDDAPAVEPAAFAADGRWTSAPPRLDGDPESGLLTAELRGHLLRAVDGLSPDQRAVITLRDLVGLPAAEVCDVLELSEGNQRVLLHRARSRVRAALVPLVEVSH